MRPEYADADRLALLRGMRYGFLLLALALGAVWVGVHFASAIEACWRDLLHRGS